MVQSVMVLTSIGYGTGKENYILPFQNKKNCFRIITDNVTTLNEPRKQTTVGNEPTDYFYHGC